MRQGSRSGQRVKDPHANRTKAAKVSTATPSIAGLQKQLNARSRELKEAREHQTAIAEVLQIINSSQGDLAPVFDGILQRAIRLCDAAFGNLWLYEGEKFDLVAAQGPFPSSYLEMLSQAGQHAGPHTAMRRAVLTQQTIQIPDYQLEQAYLDRDPVAVATAEVGNARTILAVPMVGEARALGVFFVYRQEVRSFSKRQIALLQSFAAQAVIAMENARLLTETREALEQQTATADVLRVISRSAFNLQAVLDTLVTSATQLCDADAGIIWLRKDDLFHAGAAAGFSPEEMAFFRDNPRSIRDKSLAPRVLRSRQTEHIPDRSLDPEFAFPGLPSLPSKSMLGVPLLRNDLVEGVFTLTRVNVAPFTPRQIALVESFADQAVIAISNVELFQQVQASTRELSQSLEDLRMAQDRLVQTEKLASLGQLTAGIAHEIKNPLNFVNNFSALSAELIEEMKDMLSDVSLDKNKRKDLDEITQMLKSNLDKVVQHGKRADSIVKNMLLHSRQGSGEHRPVDINAIVDESLNLAYHGARAENTGFNIAMHRSFDPAGGMAEGYPQEITRALLNLISNGFYAATKRKADVGAGFEPTLTATTKNLGDKVEIRIRDNGTGIPTELKEKIFNPFFTTKPAGEGTGLGLSMSHDIVVKQHGGTIDVVSEPGAFTEFRIVLPRAGAALIKSGEEG